jgi:hypothetical protein
MNTTVSFDKSLIAPCGMNCGTCLAYLRDKNKCCGCWPVDGKKVNHCYTCSIKNCQFLEQTNSKFCYECEKYPCLTLKQLDKRYRTRYKMSMIQNLDSIQRTGIEEYLKHEIERWTCLKCGSTICVHRDNCLKCGNDLNKKANEI